MDHSPHGGRFSRLQPPHDDAEDDDDDAPLVFQCRKCLTIIGDSSRLVSSDETWLLLSGLSSVFTQMQDSTVVSPRNTHTKADAFCANCRSKLGYAIKDVQQDESFDRTCWSFRIDISAITSYQLGHFEDPFSNVPKTKIQTNSAPAMDLNRLSEQILKIEKVILLFNERIVGIEKVLSEQQPTSTTVDPNQGESSLKPKESVKRAKKPRISPSETNPSTATNFGANSAEATADMDASTTAKG
eukprot:TRINITY_DN2958_c0_g1_i1.p1 TRINITY_DN2958_c0_g1~~TRINITY_DN2958_c0_g1_i1.p1  ORF type:complete len:243 (-),score=44.33 TRINITY_DN2958_c0_g1_i1:1125-1853(-)